MINILNYLNEVTSSEESPIILKDEIIGWHIVLFDIQKNALGGGFHTNKEIARKIAIAEVAERKVVQNLLASNLKNKFKLDSHPSTCGFAAGFESEKTRLRAMAESIERWAWSMWIDENYKIESVKIENVNLKDIDSYFINFFDSVIFFNKKINTEHIKNFVDSVDLGIVIGFKDGGAFPGSRVSHKSEDNWTHALVEAVRHLQITKKYTGSIDKPFPYGRIFYFAKNKKVALEQVAKAYKDNWPTPHPLLLLNYETNIDGLYIWRSLMNNYLSWEVGNKDRFVY